MQILDTIETLRRFRANAGDRVGLVPTMGALHGGHVKLVQTARQDCDTVIATIFVNPSQFARAEEAAAYPRDLNKDLAALEQVGVDAVFTPTSEMMYPPGFQTWVDVGEVSHGLEGARRPGHFRGVATVVMMLFNLVQPQMAYFGQKDAQQVAVIKRMVRDLKLPVSIAVCPTVREADGLAMSSRNVFLTPEQREAAPILYRALRKAAREYEAGLKHPRDLREEVLSVLDSESAAAVDYVSIVDAMSLKEVERPTDAPLLVSLVVRMGQTRLLDNLLLPDRLNTREGLTTTLGGPSELLLTPEVSPPPAAQQQ